MVAMSSDLHALIRQEGSNLQMQGNRVICCLNGHSMPTKADAVQAFINGKRYKKLAWQKAEEEALSKYEPFLVQSKNFPDKLFCTLTCQVMNKTVDNVRKHMKGRRFIQAKEEFEQDKRELLEEPELEASEGSGCSIDDHAPDEAMQVLGEADALQALEAVSMGDEQDTEPAHPQPEEEQPAEIQQQRPRNKKQAGQPSGNKPKKPPRAGARGAVARSSGAANATAAGSGAAKGSNAGRPDKAPKTPALMGQKRSAEKMVKKNTNRRKKQRTS